MSKNTKTETPKQKKNVGYRLLAALMLIACVGILFLPLSTFTSHWAVGKQTLIETVKAVIASDVKMFGFLPVLVSGSDLIAYAANLALYLFAIALVVAFVLSLIAIFAKKKSPRLTRAAVFFFTWGTATYALSILCITSYLPMVVITYDLYASIAALAGAFFYFFLMLAKVGKAAWMNAVHFWLSLITTALLLLAMTYEGHLVSEAINKDATFMWVLFGIVVWQGINLFIATTRAMSKKGLACDVLRSIVQILATLAACYVSYAGKIDSEKFLLYSVLASVVAVFQLVIIILQINAYHKIKTAKATEAALANFETEEYVEAYAYEGGPVAGVVVAEEVTPTAAAQDAASGNAQPNLAMLVGNGFDAFMFTLNDEEKEEFIDLYILRCKVNMPEIPAYQVGGDNKEFFNKVFIYLGQYREKISDALLAKMYKFSMKLS